MPPVCQLCQAKGIAPLNQALAYLYSSGFWVPAWRGAAVANCFFTFLRCYQRLAFLTVRMRKARFALIPKLHSLHHFAVRLRQDASKGAWVINCLSTSVQMQEDFVGRPSRVSRRVDIRRLHRNTLLRCLIHYHFALTGSDADKRHMDAYLH